MTMPEAIVTLTNLAIRVEELQKTLVEANKLAIRCQLQLESAMKDADKFMEWSGASRLSEGKRLSQ